mgnify:CR=1 FL=1
MKIDVRRIFEIEGEREDFCFELDLSETEIWSHKPLTKPVKIEGCVKNRSSIVTLAYKASGDLHTFCDRCLVEFDDSIDLDFEYTLVRELQDVDAQNEINAQLSAKLFESLKTSRNLKEELMRRQQEALLELARRILACYGTERERKTYGGL